MNRFLELMMGFGLGLILVSFSYGSTSRTLPFPTDPLDEVLVIRSQEKVFQTTGDSQEPSIPSTGSEIQDNSVYAGLPIVPATLCKDYMVLENDSYKVGYCKSLSIALWSAFRLFHVDNMGTPGKRPPYKDDERTGVKLGSEFYSKTGFDAGHLAPNAGIYNRFGRAGQLETFLLSNFGPQTPRLNRGPWRSLEHYNNVEYAQKFEEIWVIAGPIIKEGLPLIKDKVPIAEHYFKIVIDVLDGKPRSLGFIMPNADKMGSYLDRHFVLKKQDDWDSGYDGLVPVVLERLVMVELNSFLVSIDQIESRTGLDFYSELDDHQEEALEAIIPEKVW